MRLNTTLSLYEGEEMDEKPECFRNCAELMLSLTMYCIQVLSIPFKREKYGYYEPAERMVGRLQKDGAKDLMGIIQKQ